MQDMTETATLLEPGFSVADAGYPSFTLNSGILLLEFIDWQARSVRVRFLNAAGVKWQELYSRGPEKRDDGVYEIDASSWIEEYLSSYARTPDDHLRHFRLCFNASGVLDILAESMTLEDAG